MILSFLLLLTFTVTVTSGFSRYSNVPFSSIRKSDHQQQSLLFAGVVMETENQARWILSRAKQCAYDDECSVDDANILLREMIHLQSGCVTGTLVGHDLCEEQDVAADVVARLREKTKNGSIHINDGSQSMVPWIATELSLGALMIVIAIFWTTLDMSDRHGATSITMEEWWWAINDGYLPGMIEHYFQNGGL